MKAKIYTQTKRDKERAGYTSELLDSIYGKGCLDTQFTYHKWVLTKKFPFIKRKIIFKGTVMDLQKLINDIRNY